MDGTTEPIIVVIGHPIAGNPTQFALERALRSLSLDWRVLSFDVRPDDVAAALEGFSVTGIVGVMVDPSVTTPASRWYAEKASADLVAIDCLYRDQHHQFVGCDEQRAWVQRRIADHAGENRIWIGDRPGDPCIDENGFAEQSADVPPDPETIRQANLIVLATRAGSPVDLETEDWPGNDGSTLVIDLTRGHPERATLQQRGYSVVTNLQRRIGTLQHCLQRWTGELPSAEVIHDAIEEYLGF